MARYESTIIVNPVHSEEDLKKVINKYRKFLKSNNAEIVFEDNWGLRKLAYPINHKNSGHYHLFEFNAPGDLIDKLEIQFRRDEDILRFLTVSIDKHAIAYNEKKRQKNKEIKEKQETVNIEG